MMADTSHTGEEGTPMAKLLRLTPEQRKRAALTAHFELYTSLFRKKFPESNFVSGEGNLMSEVAFVGEAPGLVENEEGRPFVGKSGKMLSDWLNSVGMRRGEIYMTYMLKYRPPGDRKPEGDEVPVCNNLLRQELTILKPTIVVTLGVHATSLFWEAPHMPSLAGKMHERRGFVVLPMYTPAAALYEEGTRLQSFQHIKAVAHAIGRRPRSIKPEKRKLQKVA